MTGVTFASAGTGAFGGAGVSEGAILVGFERGLDLSSHRARPLTAELVADSNLILAMSEQHVAAAVELGAAEKTFLLDGYASGGRTSNAVGDPFGENLDAYRASADDIERQVGLAIERIAAAGEQS